MPQFQDSRHEECERVSRRRISIISALLAVLDIEIISEHLFIETMGERWWCHDEMIPQWLLYTLDTRTSFSAYRLMLQAAHAEQK